MSKKEAAEIAVLVASILLMATKAILDYQLSRESDGALPSDGRFDLPYDDYY